MTITLGSIKDRRQPRKRRFKRLNRDLMAVAFSLAVPFTLGGVLSLAQVQHQPPGDPNFTTLPTDDLEEFSAQTEATPVSTADAAPSVEETAEAIALNKRLREVELQLIAEKREAARRGRYDASLGEGVVVEAPKETSVYAFGRESDRVSIDCAATEFGQVAIMATTADPDHFYKARFVTDCVAGEVAAGTVIGNTVGDELGWSQHSQLTGASIAPDAAPLEWALTGYTGQHSAPEAEEVNPAEIWQSAKSTGLEIWQSEFGTP